MPTAKSKNDDLLPLFDQLKDLLSRFEPPLVASVKERSQYELKFDKDYETKSERTGKVSKKHGMYFAGLIVQKNYVGLYFMPIYSHFEEFNHMSPRLLKTLKGKSCFYVTDLDDVLKQEIKKMLDKGYVLYEKFNGRT